MILCHHIGFGAQIATNYVCTALTGRQNICAGFGYFMHEGVVEPACNSIFTVGLKKKLSFEAIIDHFYNIHPAHFIYEGILTTLFSEAGTKIAGENAIIFPTIMGLAGSLIADCTSVYFEEPFDAAWNYTKSMVHQTEEF